MRPIIAITAATLAILAATHGAAVAQSRTPPDTSVRALEPPADVRRQQLGQQTPPATNSGTSMRRATPNGGPEAPPIASPAQ
jgi:hypothetical protein